MEPAIHRNKVQRPKIGSRTTDHANDVKIHVITASKGLQHKGREVDSLLLVTKVIDIKCSIQQQPCAATTAKPSQLIWIPAGNEYKVSATSGKADIVMFETPVSDRDDHESATQAGELLTSSQLTAPCQRASTILEAMARSFVGSGGYGGHLMARSICQIAVNELLQTLTVKPALEPRQPRLSERQLADVFEFIEDNYERKVETSEMADAAGLSQFHFARAFTASVGVSPYAYLLERRIAHAKKFLETTDEAIALIAYDVGFSSQSHMTDVFCRHVGTSPAKYRKRQNAAKLLGAN